MMHNPGGRTTRVLRLTGLTAAVVVFSGVALASPAMAATTSQSTAKSVGATLTTGVQGGSAVESAQNDGSSAATTVSSNPDIGGPNAGEAAATAVARSTGTSASCAGFVGPGGSLAIDAAGVCAPSGATGPLRWSLGNLVGDPTLGANVDVAIYATAIYSQCVAGPSDAGSFSASTTFDNAQLVATSPDPSFKTITIPLSSGAVDLGPLASAMTLETNATTGVPSGPVVTDNALNVTIKNGYSGTGLASATLGLVSCGANAVTAEIPMVPFKGLGISALTALVFGAGFIIRRRRRNASA